MSRLILPFADQQVEIPSLTAGNIAITVGLKQVKEKCLIVLWAAYFEKAHLPHTCEKLCHTLLV